MANPCPETTSIALAAASLNDRDACRERVISALESIVQFDDDDAMKQAARRRFNDLTKGRNPA